METRAFLSAFRSLPSPLAGRLDVMLERRNDRNRDDDDERQLDAYRRYAAGFAGRVDVVLIGHVHRPLDEPATNPRLVVPGGWFGRAGYFKVEASGGSLVIDADPAPTLCSPAPPSG
jgi:UDP-2,3-diacylglucosamine hydrolase